jgi:hypothetical protein
MSDVEKLLDKNKKKVIWYTTKTKVKKVVTNVVGVLEEDIIDHYGSVEEFERNMEGDSLIYDNLIATMGYHTQIVEGYMPLDIEPIYDLSYEEFDGEVDYESEREDKKGFHLYNGSNKQWFDDNSAASYIRALCEVNLDENWNKLRKDLGLSYNNISEHQRKDLL